MIDSQVDHYQGENEKYKGNVQFQQWAKPKLNSNYKYTRTGQDIMCNNLKEKTNSLICAKHDKRKSIEDRQQPLMTSI